MNILITGARFFYALELARAFHSAGHKVFIAESLRPHLCNVSNSVSKCLKLPSPRYDYDGFVRELSKIIEENEIDLLVPVFEEALYIAKAKSRLPSRCNYFCSSFTNLNQLHNKWLYHQLLEQNSIQTIPAKIIKNQDDLQNVDFSGPYILKPSYSRGACNMRRGNSIDDFKDISFDPNNPWILQKLIVGERFCSYSICRDGEVKAHAVYASKADKKDYCLYFRSIRHEKICKWVQNLCSLLSFTGHLSFDFIVDADGTLYSIECNPRATSGLHLLNEEQIVKGILSDEAGLIEADIDRKKQLAVGMLIYGWGYRERGEGPFHFFKKFFTFGDVVYSKNDPRPFVLQPLILGTCVLRAAKMRMSLPLTFFDDIVWEQKIG